MPRTLNMGKKHPVVSKNRYKSEVSKIKRMRLNI